MWQRLQTLYLGIATLLIAALFWCDIGRIPGPDGAVEHISFTSKTIYLIWVILLTVVQILALFGYKWRMKQFRVVLVSAFLCIGFQVWVVVDYFIYKDMMTFSVAALFPFVAAILDFMGARNILLDEAIVQSANRLRSPRSKKK